MVVKLLTLLAFSFLVQADNLNDRPVIGVLSLPMESTEDSVTVDATSYIVASYVKWLQGAGARVVPIKVDYTYEQVDALFPKLNGFLFTGGSANIRYNGKLTAFGRMGCYIYNLVKKANDEGKYTPLWGTCLGYQFINICETSNAKGLMTQFDGKPGYLKVTDFTDIAENSRLFGYEDGDYVMNIMASEAVTYLYHGWGITRDTYNIIPALPNAFNILATQRDKSGAMFVSIIEAKHYPIYGTQFHPEKNMYEWKYYTEMPHSVNAVEISSYLASFFVNEARKNMNEVEKLDAKAYDDILIYNELVLYVNGYYEQVYYMNP